ncbi:2-C-methyl-D-erythritol 2,4-cyclodiphosphate synthase [Frankliniella fusca]|uniref:2-C-methyl-D-erythritol 2,4-cyclodiphosphate synthase n=1 Tax=Frankliniella fusca TaxID=407009 RepID=A0AAE1GPS9_9NEOP|nr:2-C-methyl-D-erythritol 2,4-cyclodiphosphate synthase [Frankliniella fusca]
MARHSKMDDTDDSRASSDSKTAKRRVSRRAGKRSSSLKEEDYTNQRTRMFPLALVIQTLLSIRADFLDNHLTDINELSSKVTGRSATEGYFTSADYQDDSTTVSASLEQSDMSSDTSVDSRPTSSASSRPGSSLLGDVSIPHHTDSESRPKSAASSTSAIVHCNFDTSEDANSSACTSATPLSVSELSPSVQRHSMLGAVRPQENIQCSPSLQCIEHCLAVFKRALPQAWTVICTRDSFHLLYLSLTSPKAVQREVRVYFNGTVSIYIHAQSIMDKQVLLNNTVPPLENDSQPIIQQEL